jgi:DoxX
VSILECATVGEAYAAAGSIRIGRCFLALPDPRADRPVHHFIGGAAHALAASRHLGKMTMQETENTAELLGRVAMSVIFIHGGWGKLLAPVATQAMLAGHHLPMVQLGWLLAIVVELGGGLAILIGLFTPSGRAGAGDMVRRHRPDCAYEFRRPQSGDPFLEKHGDDGRVSLRRRVRRPRLESRRMVVAPRRRGSSRLNLTLGSAPTAPARRAQFIVSHAAPTPI